MKTQIDFRTLACVCKYSHWAYDENHETIQACNHKDNRPPNQSWGECCEKDCPLLRCELQKPLTLEELLSFDGTDIDGIKPVWCEDATGDENSGWILFDCKQMRTFNPYENEWYAFCTGKFIGKAGCWRPWLRKPTDEERSAAEWASKSETE